MPEDEAISTPVHLTTLRLFWGSSQELSGLLLRNVDQIFREGSPQVIRGVICMGHV
jgi:hypothetical protein